MRIRTKANIKSGIQNVPRRRDPESYAGSQPASRCHAGYRDYQGEIGCAFVACLACRKKKDITGEFRDMVALFGISGVVFRNFYRFN